MEFQFPKNCIEKVDRPIGTMEYKCTQEYGSWSTGRLVMARYSDIVDDLDVSVIYPRLHHRFRDLPMEIIGLPKFIENFMSGDINALDQIYQFMKNDDFCLSTCFLNLEFLERVMSCLEINSPVVLDIFHHLWSMEEDPESLVFSSSLIQKMVEFIRVGGIEGAAVASSCLTNVVLTDKSLAIQVFEFGAIQELELYFGRNSRPHQLGRFALSLINALYTQLPNHLLPNLNSLIPYILGYVSSQFCPCRVKSCRCILFAFRNEESFEICLSNRAIEILLNAQLLRQREQISYLYQCYLVLIGHGYDKCFLNDTFFEQINFLLKDVKLIESDDFSLICRVLRQLMNNGIGLMIDNGVLRQLIKVSREGGGGHRIDALSCIADYLLNADDTYFLKVVEMGGYDLILELVQDCDPPHLNVMLRAIWMGMERFPELKSSVAKRNFGETCYNGDDEQCWDLLSIITNSLMN
jgi:hypothetical protein